MNEPNTNGKVLLVTSIGALEIELWPSKAPNACERFVRSGASGRYDGCAFAKISKNFMAQISQPREAAKNETDPYDDVEVDARLRFDRPGRIGTVDGSSFFVTLGPCRWLDGKNTIFGKVVGNSIYDVLKLNERRVDEDDVPLDGEEVVLRSFDVLDAGPYDELVEECSALKKNASSNPKPSSTTRKAKPALISFDDDDDDEFEVSTKKRKVDPSSLLRTKKKKKKKSIVRAVETAVVAPSRVSEFRRENAEKKANASDKKARLMAKLAKFT